MNKNLIKALIDKRIVEATKNKISTKLFCVAKHLGTPIIQDITNNILPDFYNDKEETIEEEDLYGEPSSYLKIGYVYDSLSRGFHFDVIVLCTRDEEITSMKAMYKGFVVYKTEGEEIECYVPNKEWETHLDNIYEMAKKTESFAKKEEKENKIKSISKMKKGFLEKLKLLWGYQ